MHRQTDEAKDRQTSRGKEREKERGTENTDEHINELRSVLPCGCACEARNVSPDIPMSSLDDGPGNDDNSPHFTSALYS